MLKMTMAQSTHQSPGAEYDQALKEFQDLRQHYTRTAFDGRKFVLVNQITHHLQRTGTGNYSNNLSRLLFSAHHVHQSSPPVVRSADLIPCHAIFYILIELGKPSYLHLFRDRGFNDSYLPISLADLREKIRCDDTNFDKFLQSFSQEQYSWCPMMFTLDMGQFHHDRVIPLYDKFPLEIRRDDHQSQSGDAKLWGVVVSADLVSRDMQSQIEDARTIRRDETYGDEVCYRFVLKEFQTSHEPPVPGESSPFDRDKKMNTHLKDTDGILRYFGWFQYQRSKNDREYFNLVLEQGDDDFYTYMRKYYPPVSPQETLLFWERMVDLSSGLRGMHNLMVENIKYRMCHGDIKPENIVSVNGRFKIADPAEAGIELSIAGDAPQTRMTGGTVTYASPEKSQFREGSKIDLSVPNWVPLNSDVWSLGCVFSVAATYVVLGSLGVEQYQRLRIEANRKLRSRSIDSFHDGSDVLPEIQKWHEYLHVAARRTDKLTGAVLHIVDNYMLVSDHKNRASATDVLRLLSDVVCQGTTDRALFPPQGILDFLESLEADEQSYDPSSSAEDLRSISISSFRNTGPTKDRADSQSVHQPTSQRLQQHQIRVSGSRASSIRDHIIDEISSMHLSLIKESDQRRYSDFSNILDPDLQSVTDMWMVEAELEKLQNSSLLRRNRLRSVKREKQISKDDELKDFFENRDLVFLVDNSRSMLPHWSHATYLIRILTWRALGYDEDGMELYFTETSEQVKQKKDQNPDHFVNAMKKAKPTPNSDGSPNRILEKLQTILGDPSRVQQNRPKTIIVLTDGVWEGLPREDAVDELIRYHLGLLPEDVRTQFSRRPITFQFISFGYNKAALERLRRLDDDLKLEDYPDFVDTEPATGGDVYKMFLGSLSEAIDQAEYYCPRCGPRPSRSPTLLHTPRNRHSTSDTRVWSQYPSQHSPQDSPQHLHLGCE